MGIFCIASLSSEKIFSSMITQPILKKVKKRCENYIYVGLFIQGLIFTLLSDGYIYSLLLTES
jgi:hypothetical protein